MSLFYRNRRYSGEWDTFRMNCRAWMRFSLFIPFLVCFRKPARMRLDKEQYRETLCALAIGRWSLGDSDCGPPSHHHYKMTRMALAFIIYVIFAAEKSKSK